MTGSVTLRRKVVIALIGLVAGCLAFTLAGTYAYLKFAEDSFYAALSPEAADAYASDWNADGLPPLALVEEISLAEETYLYPAYENEFWVFSLLSVIAVAFGGLFAVRLSRRLTEPLVHAAQSAKTIADGNFAHTMPALAHASSEIVSLHESFTYLSTSLQRMENNIRYTTASVAHELRTPLTVIQGYIQGIQDGVFTANKAQLDAILQQVSSVTRIVDDLKLISLAETRELVLDAETSNIADCVRDAVAFMQPQFREAGRTLAVAAHHTDTYACFDEQRIRQAVIALISNAFRYAAREGHCRVICQTNSTRVTIAVEDNGPGWPDAALEHASDPFWRGDASRARDSGGTGLGLAVVKAIAHAHGGTLELSQIASGGARATITLPKA